MSSRFWREGVLCWVLAMSLAGCDDEASGAAPGGADGGGSLADGTMVSDAGHADVPTLDAESGDGGPIGADGGVADLGARVGRASLTGTVWAPRNGPGDVPEGEEIPIAGALVNLTPERMDPIPPGVYCEMCVPVPSTAVVTDDRGRFAVANHPVGEYWLTIQKGQFRRAQRIQLEDGRVYTLPPAATTLPNRHDPENGLWTPRMAVAVGQFDRIEEVLGKLGIGEVDIDGTFVVGSTEPAHFNVDIYDNGGPGFDGRNEGTLEELALDLTRLRGYHILFIPCSGLFDFGQALQNPLVRQNLREYVIRGGKLYVTDWSGEWHDNIFPAQIELGPDEDTPPEAWDDANMTWNPELFGDANGDEYDTPNAEAVDERLASWLSWQSGPSLRGGRGAIDPGSFFVQGNWNTIESVNTVELGQNRDGETVYDEPKVWVVGGSEARPEPKKPLTVSYEPAGCGRVLYSTYHTADDTHVGLVPQERVLIYLIMELGICRDPKVF